MNRENHASKKEIFNSLSRKSSEKAELLHRIFKAHGINFATGIPCGVLRDVIDNLLSDSEIQHVSVNRESEAIGIAAGAYLSGKIPIVYMQNSGLFASSNDIASLIIPYRIPMFFVVSYRGCKGEDAVQHFVTGQATEQLLRSFGLPYAIYDKQDLKILIDRLFFTMKQKNLPAILLLKRGWSL